MGQQMGGFELDVNQCTADRDGGVGGVRPGLHPPRLPRRASAPSTRTCSPTSRTPTTACGPSGPGSDVVCAGGGHLRPPPEHVDQGEQGRLLVGLRASPARSFTRKWAQWLEHDRYDGDVAWHSVVHQPMGYAVQSRHLMTALHFAGRQGRLPQRLRRRRRPHRRLPPRRHHAARRSAADVTQVALCQADAFARSAGRHTGRLDDARGHRPAPGRGSAGCNSMDEVWVPASFNVETFRDAAA